MKSVLPNLLSWTETHRSVLLHAHLLHKAENIYWCYCKYMKLKQTLTSKIQNKHEYVQEQVINCIKRTPELTSRNTSENSAFQVECVLFSQSTCSPCLAKHHALEHRQGGTQPCSAINTNLSTNAACYQTWRSKQAAVKRKMTSVLSAGNFGGLSHYTDIYLSELHL